MSTPRWQRTWRADPRLAALADRHYSRKTVGAAQFAPPGRCLPLITAAGDAGWVTSWPLHAYTMHGLGDAWICTLFRNESEHLSSELICEAVAATRAEWGAPPPGGTLTFVDASKIRRKRDPGRCFLRAGFKRLDRLTKDRGLVVLRLAAGAHPEAETPAHFQTRMAT
jgi:hypothetical protein